jgi:DNA-binding transcriptional regulator YiaG
MPNIGSVLKEEITRLSRKEVRKQIEPVRKSSNQQRTDIARLKRDVSALRKQIRTLSKSSSVPATQQDRPAEMIRFVAKGLKAQRTRLGLSAADYAKLVGVSGQTVYNWEQGAANPAPSSARLSRRCAASASEKRKLVCRSSMARQAATELAHPRLTWFVHRASCHRAWLAGSATVRSVPDRATDRAWLRAPHVLVADIPAACADSG